MGSECSNLFDHITHQNISRTKLMDFISNTTLNKQSNQKSIDFDFNFDLKLQFVKKIENQFIKQNSKDVLSYQKFPESRFIVKFKDGSNYKGNIDEKGKRQKEGQQTWADGTKYIGNWKQNLPNGNGVILSQDSYTFEGNWILGVVEGFGKYYGKLGSYEGDWKQNRPHGYGVQTWQDGSRYQGNYKQGKKQEKGKYFWPDKSSYDGDWSEGKITGMGTYRYVDGRVYKGSFNNNQMHGQGIYSWPDGRKYIGSYENDKKQGIGRYIWSDGRYYEGQWREGKRNGYGKIVYPNGDIKYGIWDDDKKIQETSQKNYDTKNNAESTLVHSQQASSMQRGSPSFRKKQNCNRLSSFPKKRSQDFSMRRSITLPKTEGRPLYASSISPYKELKQYYEEYNGESGNMKDRLLNRYRFINSPLRKFNQMQVSGGGSYLSMRKQKNRNLKQGQNDYKYSNSRNIGRKQGLNEARSQCGHQRRDSSYM